MCRVAIQDKDFSVATEYSRMRERVNGKAGAITSFVGLVRDIAQSQNVDGLVLEHYPGMTEKSIERIIDQAKERWRLLDVTVIHRIGHLHAADQIVLVIVASSHRPDAFAACEFLMDFLKTEAIFWKKEIRGDEEVWIDSTANDRSRRDGWKT